MNGSPTVLFRRRSCFAYGSTEEKWSDGDSSPHLQLNASQNVDNYCSSTAFPPNTSTNLTCSSGIRAAPDIGLTNGTFANGVNSAILRYTGAPAVEPVTNETLSLLQLNETDLHVCTCDQVKGKRCC